MEKDNNQKRPIRGADGTVGKYVPAQKRDGFHRDNKAGQFGEQKKGLKPIPPKLRQK